MPEIATPNHLSPSYLCYLCILLSSLLTSLLFLVNIFLICFPDVPVLDGAASHTQGGKSAVNGFLT